MRPVRKACLLLVASVAAWAAVGTSAALADIVLLQDDFSGALLDLTKWSAAVDDGCSLTLENGQLVSQFTGAGAPRGSFAVSNRLELPAGWTSVTVSGTWAFTVRSFGEMVLKVFDADDPTVYVQQTYYLWNGPGLRNQSTNITQQQARNVPTTLTPFSLVITPTSWEYYEDGVQVPEITESIMTGTQVLQLEIGGWEYSAVFNEARFDDIVVTALPEPATLALLGAGGLAALIRRRRA